MAYQPQATPKDDSVTATKINTALKGGAAAGTEALRALGTTATTAAAGNDSRIVGAEQTANKNAANGYAGLSASSLLSLAQMGTGTPSAANFLRGDGTWAAPTASSPSLAIQSLTTAGTANIDSIVKCDATSGAFTVTLPAAASNSGKTIRIKKTDASANAVTLDPNASELINGNSTHILSMKDDAVEVSSDGTGWHIF